MIIVNILGYLSLLFILFIIITIIVNDTIESRRDKKAFEKGRIDSLEKEFNNLHRAHYELKNQFITLQANFENS